MKLTYELSDEALQDLININQGIFYPLDGFMTSSDYNNVVKNMVLKDGSVWTIPINLDVNQDTYTRAKQSDKLSLTYGKKEVGMLEIADCYEVDTANDVPMVYGTADTNHPVVMKELHRSKYRIGGRTTVTDKSILENSLSPEKTIAIFTRKRWKTVVAFHTRNPVHRAHEHLQRVGLELCDGLFINPFLGWKKDGDFSDEAIIRSYEVLIDNYYPKDRVYLQGLRSSMRYAGPREAVFHALIRRNLGCTHFIVGRDHAGVGNYYGRYEAQELCRSISSKADLGIEFMLLQEPYFCEKCNQVVSEKHCGHSDDYRTDISGTEIRRMLSANQLPGERFLRKEVADVLLGMGDRRFVGQE
ncbi:sulfate adenylyltransferase [Chloroflexota bacterium]